MLFLMLPPNILLPLEYIFTEDNDDLWLVNAFAAYSMSKCVGVVVFFFVCFVGPGFIEFNSNFLQQKPYFIEYL